MTDESNRAAQAALRKMDRIVVAIHGVGSQQRSETLRRVTFRFGSRVKPPMALMPLGFFHVDRVGDVKVSQLEDVPQNDLLETVGFAEVFWADIPKKVDKEGDTLEEIKGWGRTVVSRAEAAYHRKVPERDRKLKAEDFGLGAAVIEEIVETVAVMENLLFVADKMGLLKFNLAPVLREYVGDVQVVAEFKFFRDQIVYRFHKAMHDVVKGSYDHPDEEPPKVYVVAHSEGTVVSFLAMLEALSNPPDTIIFDPDAPDDATRAVSTNWIRFVRGFMTIGSPIDKHLVLWPQLWKDLRPTERRLDAPIQWRNYYDYGDPIGFKLDTAAAFLEHNNCKAFAFKSDRKTDDFGFSRYWLPGKAHNDYWTDGAVFEHFIQDVVLRKPDSQPMNEPPGNRPLVGPVSTASPYVLSVALHLAAVFMLFKAVTAYMAGPNDEPTIFAVLTRAVLCLGGLLTGVTVAARLPRLVNRRWSWRWLAVAYLMLMAGVCWVWLPDPVATFFGGALIGSSDPSTLIIVGKSGLLIIAAIVAATGWLLPRKPSIARRTLIGLGTAAVLALVVSQIRNATLKHHPEAWPLVLAGAAFLYLWWLGILTFDLAFVWHRYIRNSVALETLGYWYHGKEAKPKTLKEILRPSK
jgi:hypothetical protein